MSEKTKSVAVNVTSEVMPHNPAVSVPHLFTPLQLREVKLRNRIIVSPMCQYASVNGYATDWHLVHLGSRAVGGAGAVMTEATAVLPEGRISPDDLGIWDDGHIEMLSRIFHFIEEHGAVPGIQLAHAGRKASTASPWKGNVPLSSKEGGWEPIYSPWKQPFDGCQIPHALTLSGIRRVQHAFESGAQRALAAGARIAEVHAAHGYLLHEFLSPLTNLRKDEYGGSFENRTRMLRETVEKVRLVWPERYPVLVRISATDWTEGGWTVDDSVQLAKILRKSGVDLIDCSSGGLLPRSVIPLGSGYQVAMAGRIRKEAKIATGAVGMIIDPHQADQTIRTGQADVVLLGREFLRDPYWPLHAAQRLNHEPPAPLQYLRAF